MVRLRHRHARDPRAAELPSGLSFALTRLQALLLAGFARDRQDAGGVMRATKAQRKPILCPSAGDSRAKPVIGPYELRTDQLCPPTIFASPSVSLAYCPFGRTMAQPIRSGGCRPFTR